MSIATAAKQAAPATALPDLAPAPASALPLAAAELDLDLLRPLLPNSAFLDNRATLKIMLSNPAHGRDRQLLERYVEEWLELLGTDNDSATVAQLESRMQNRAQHTERTFLKNRKSALEQTRELERAWQNLSLFFQNQGGRVRHNQLLIVNASAEEAGEDSEIFEKVATELYLRYDRLVLSDAFSFVVVPGWLGNRSNIDRWAVLCRETFCQLFTDFRNEHSAAAIQESQDKEQAMDIEPQWANVVLFANWLIGRRSIGEGDFSEEEDLHISPAAAVAGRLCDLPLHQPVMGFKMGLRGGNEARIQPLLHAKEINPIARLLLNPVVTENRKTIVFNDSTAYSGDPQIDLSSYPVVRTKMALSKALKVFLNLSAGEVFSETVKEKKKQQMVRFLEQVKKMGAIRQFKILQFARDPLDPRKIWLEISIEFETIAKSFTIKIFSMEPDDSKSAK